MNDSHAIFTAQPSLADFGELSLLRDVKKWLGVVAPASPEGMGDDTAAFEWEHSKDTTLLTSDSLVYERHFDANTSPAAAGQKLLKRNLSDIAAMGGFPSRATVSIFCGGNLSYFWLQAFYLGLAESAARYQCKICGGDMAQTNDSLFSASMTLLGHCTTPKLRNGSKIGDTLWVTGDFGGSLLGKHLDFEPRLPEGRWLAKNKSVRAMMDITDGLIIDLPKLCASEQQIALQSASIPISQSAHIQARHSGRTATWHALCDGEDYELAFVLSEQEDTNEFRRGWENQFKTPLTCIGQIQKLPSDTDPYLLFDDDSLNSITQLGYEHFRQ